MSHFLKDSLSSKCPSLVELQEFLLLPELSINSTHCPSKASCLKFEVTSLRYCSMFAAISLIRFVTARRGSIYNCDQTFFYKLNIWVWLRMFRHFLTDKKTFPSNIFTLQPILKNMLPSSQLFQGFLCIIFFSWLCKSSSWERLVE